MKVYNVHLKSSKILSVDNADRDGKFFFLGLFDLGEDISVIIHSLNPDTNGWSVPGTRVV